MDGRTRLAAAVGGARGDQAPCAPCSPTGRSVDVGGAVGSGASDAPGSGTRSPYGPTGRETVGAVGGAVTTGSP